jgi:hypothetical protein
MRLLLGTLSRDLPAYFPALMRGGSAYLAIRNRLERLEPAPDASGFRCNWQWTSDLHAPKVIPALGRHLMRRALAAHPILRADTPAITAADNPQVSFLIGHRGAERLPHLLATLQSIAAQRGVTLECIVVEQDTASQLGPHLPPWVRLVHTPPPSPEMPYCRSWAFNVGAQHARAAVLVLHDNDMLVPADYAAQILHRVTQGYDVVNLKRFIFYLTQAHTGAIFGGRAGLLDAAPDVIVQNLEGGASVGITRAGFDQIGGMDESFIGWGGEDNEFWERAETLPVWPWANMALVHLCHAAQPGKHDTQCNMTQHYHALAQIDAPERIRRLKASSQGCIEGPLKRPDVIASVQE